jgi:hypothetical protein
MYDFEGESNYNSLQVTLSRQTSRRLQYFATYTLSNTQVSLVEKYRWYSFKLRLELMWAGRCWPM